ncbi:hypothetical protein JW710_04885 [Candidatus Dojkabacteria bacterium]|nr:hypothetical protein [Candidatus Dojkabacteria bacterium]
MIFVLYILISVSVLFVVSESYAQPTVELVLDPNRLEIPVGSESIALTAKASGSGLKFEWKLRGPGKFEGETTDAVIFYIPPQEIEGESQKVIITIMVTDKNGDQVTGSITFKIIKPNGDGTPTPTPGPTSTSVDGGKVKITSLQHGDPVRKSERVSGTYKNEIEEDIWVFVCPEDAVGKCWQQSSDAKSGKPALKKNGTWYETCWFSGSINFDIVVYSATPSASQFIGDKLKEWAKNGDYKGFYKEELPEGLTEQHRITVSIKE